MKKPFICELTGTERLETKTLLHGSLMVEVVDSDEQSFGVVLSESEVRRLAEHLQGWLDDE